MKPMYADRLLEKITATRASIVMGLDPSREHLPLGLLDDTETDSHMVAEAVLQFNQGLISAVYDLIPAVKVQFACYERLGLAGVRVLTETIRFAKQHGLIVIGDAKRGDISSTALAYAESQFSPSIFDLDAVTVNAYLGYDSLSVYEDYLREDKGVYILVRTSNPSAGDIQDLKLNDNRLVYQAVADQVHAWGEAFLGTSGYSSIGAVVGATWPKEAKELRERMPNTPFLIPGYGHQGGRAEDAVAGFSKGMIDLVNASRSIMTAYRNYDTDYKRAARLEVIHMRDALEHARAGLR